MVHTQQVILLNHSQNKGGKLAMINFNLKGYEWQKSMDIIMQNINLSKINITDNVTIIFEFLNSYNGDDYKKIVCHSVWKLSSDLCFAVGDEFPFFICDIRTEKLENSNIASAFAHYGFGLNIPESEEYCLLCINSGDVSISLICEKIEILDV